MCPLGFPVATFRMSLDLFLGCSKEESTPMLPIKFRIYYARGTFRNKFLAQGIPRANFSLRSTELDIVIVVTYERDCSNREFHRRDGKSRALIGTCVTLSLGINYETLDYTIITMFAIASRHSDINSALCYSHAPFLAPLFPYCRS